MILLVIQEDKRATSIMNPEPQLIAEANRLPMEQPDVHK